MTGLKGTKEIVKGLIVKQGSDTKTLEGQEFKDGMYNMIKKLYSNHKGIPEKFK